MAILSKTSYQAAYITFQLNTQCHALHSHAKTEDLVSWNDLPVHPFNNMVHVVSHFPLDPFPNFLA